MAGDQHCNHLVAQFLIAHRPAVLIARLDQQRQDIFTPGSALLATPGDLGVQEVVNFLQEVSDLLAFGKKADQTLKPRNQAYGVGPQGEHIGQAFPQPSLLGSLVHTEDATQNHIQGNLLHAGMDRKGPAGRPAVKVAVGHLTHDLAVGLHAFTMKRRGHEPPVVSMARAVEQQQGMLTDQGAQDLARLAGRQLLGIAGEDFLDRLRRTEQDKRRGPGQPDRKTRAVTPGTVAHERNRTKNPVQQLNSGGRLRAGG